MDLTDQELMEGVREGNLPSLEALFQRYGSKILALFFFLSWDRRRAEDALQELFRLFWSARTTRPPLGVVKLRLFQNAVRLRETFFTGETDVADVGIDWTHPFWIGYMEPQKEEPEEDGEWAEKVKKALEDIPETRRIPLILLRYAGLRLENVSTILARPAGGIRRELHASLDELATALVVDPKTPLAPCREAPPDFPLPGERLEPGSHADTCPACRRRFESHKDVWEILTDLASPSPREGLWPELKKTLASSVKSRNAYPTGRLPRPVPEETIQTEKSSRFWLRLTAVASVLLALIALYLILNPPGNGRPGRTREHGTEPPGASATYTEAEPRVPRPAPRPFLLAGGASGDLGPNLTLETRGSGSFRYAVFRVLDAAQLLREVPDPRRPTLLSDELLEEMRRARRGNDGPFLRLVEETDVFLPPSPADTPRHRTLPLGTREPGLYLAQAKKEDFIAHAVKALGEISIVHRRTRTTLLARITGPPDVPNRNITASAFVGGRRHRPVETTPGLSVFRHLPENEPVILLARAGKAIALSVADPPRQPAPPPPWMVLDAPRYAPGETLTAAGYWPPDEKTIRTRVGAGGRAFRSTIPLRPAGLVLWDLRLPDDLRGERLDVAFEGTGASLRLQAALGKARRGVLPEARPEAGTLEPGEKPVFLLASAPGAFPACAFASLAHRIVFLPENGGKEVLSSGTFELDAEGKARLAGERVFEPGRVFLEIGVDEDALASVSGIRVVPPRWTATLEGTEGFAATGQTFRAVLTLTRARGDPVEGASVRTFVEGVPFAAHAGDAVRTDAQGTAAVEILFTGRGTAKITADVFEDGVRKGGDVLRVPVSDGTPFPEGGPVLRARRQGKAKRILVRGFGDPVLVSALFPGESELRSLPLDGEIARLPSAARWIFADGTADGKPVSASLPLAGSGPGPASRIRIPPSPWTAGASLEAALAPGAAEEDGTDVLLLGTAGPATGIPTPPTLPAGPAVSSGASAGFRSKGIPFAAPGPYRRADGKTPRPGAELEALKEAMAAVGVQEHEAQRYLSLDPAAAMAEIGGRLERKTPLPPLTSPPAPVPPGAREGGERAGVPRPAFSLLAGLEAGATERGRVSFRCWDRPGTYALHLLAASRGRWDRRDMTVEVKEATGIHLSVPPLRRKGDEPVLRVRLHNGEAKVLAGDLRLRPRGDEPPGDEPVRLSAGETAVKILPLPAGSDGGRVRVRFEGDGPALEAEAAVPPEIETPARTWETGGVFEKKTVATIAFPPGAREGAESLELAFARGPRDLVLQGLQRLFEMPVPDALSEAGKVLAFASAWNAFSSGEERPPAELASLTPFARQAASRLETYRTPRGGFSREPGGPLDLLATGVVSRALADARTRLPDKTWPSPAPPALLASLLERPLIGPAETAALRLGLASSKPDAGPYAPKAFRIERFDPVSLARIVLALKRRGRKEASGIYADQLARLIVLRRDTVLFYRLPGRGKPGSDPVVATALALQALAPFEEEAPLPRALVRFLVERRAGNGWGSPYRSGLVCAGLAEVFGTRPGPVPLTAEFNARFSAAAQWSASGYTTSLPPESLFSGKNILAMDCEAPGRLAWSMRLRARVRGDGEAGGDFPVSLALTPYRKSADGWREAPGTSLRRGTPVRLSVTADLPGAMRDVLVSIPLPACLRVFPRGRPASLAEGVRRDGMIEIDGKRVLWFFPHLPGGPTRLRLFGVTAWEGDYVMPPAFVRGLVAQKAGYSRALRVSIR